MYRIELYTKDFELQGYGGYINLKASLSVSELIGQIGIALGVEDFNVLATNVMLDDDTMTIINTCPYYKYKCDDIKTYELYKLLITLMKMLYEKEENVK